VSPVHGHGRDGRSRAHRGGGRPCDSRRSGQPAGRRQTTALAARAPPSTTADRHSRIYFAPSASYSCVAPIRGTHRDAYGCTETRSEIVAHPGSSGLSWAFLRLFEAGRTGSPSRCPASSARTAILTALGLTRAVLIRDNERTPPARTGEALLAATRKAPLKGSCGRHPANSDGTMRSRRGVQAWMNAAKEAVFRFISDEIITGLDDAFRSAAANCRPGARHQLFSKYWCMTGWRVGAGWWCGAGWCGRSNGCPAPTPPPPNLFFFFFFFFSRHLSIRCRPCRRSPARSGVRCAGPRWRRSRPAISRTPRTDRGPDPRPGDPNSGGGRRILTYATSPTSLRQLCSPKNAGKATVAATPGSTFDRSMPRSFIRFSYARSADRGCGKRLRGSPIG